MFPIASDDWAAKTYFLLIHVWLIHERITRQGEHGFDAVFWEALWDYFRGEIMSVRASQKKKAMGFSRSLREIQEHSYGFCVALDESLENETSWAGQLEYILWTQIYRSSPAHREGPYLRDLAVYTLRTQVFLNSLETNVFLYGSFTWPLWTSKQVSP